MLKILTLEVGILLLWVTTPSSSLYYSSMAVVPCPVDPTLWMRFKYGVVLRVTCKGDRGVSGT